MAKVTAQVMGGQVKLVDNVETVQDVLNQLGVEGAYIPMVNGEPATLNTELNDYEFVSFSPDVKGGM